MADQYAIRLLREWYYSNFIFYSHLQGLVSVCSCYLIKACVAAKSGLEKSFQENEKLYFYWCFPSVLFFL